MYRNDSGNYKNAVKLFMKSLFHNTVQDIHNEKKVLFLVCFLIYL